MNSVNRLIPSDLPFIFSGGLPVTTSPQPDRLSIPLPFRFESASQSVNPHFSSGDPPLARGPSEQEREREIGRANASSRVALSLTASHLRGD